MKQVLIGVESKRGTSSRFLADWSLKKLLADSATAWKVSPKLIIIMWSVPFIMALAGMLAAILSKDLYKWLTGEDGFAENMQVLFCALAFVLNLILTRHLWNTGHRVIAYLYLGLSFGLFFLIGEELSWGQRIFGWGTPELFEDINKQKETNLHNIYGIGSGFKWVQLLVGAYGTIFPLVIWRSTAFARFRETLSLLVPHYTLIPYFLFMFLWRIYRNFIEPSQRSYFVISEYNEVMELILYMGFALFMIFQWRRLKESIPQKVGNFQPNAVKHGHLMVNHVHSKRSLRANDTHTA